MKNRRNFYRILQVQPDAPAEIIHASYRTLMRDLKRHPDLGGSTYEAAVLNEAYETLRDPARRAAYDEELFRKYTRQNSLTSKKPVAPVLCPVCRKPVFREPAPGETCTNCRTPLQSDSQPGRLDNRGIERTKSSARIQYYSSWPGMPREGTMVDFSPKGMRFICGENLKPQTVLKISSKLFEASGTVTNSSEEKTKWRKQYAVGVCFLAITFSDTRGTFLSTSG